MSRRLKAEELQAACDPATLPFRSTTELAPLDGLIGQDRALEATTFGIGMRTAGYNLFVLGPPATGKTTSMRRLLDAAAAEGPTPSEWCYVHNFADPYRPCALEVPAGRGRQLRDEMARLVAECKARLPRLFEGEAFEREKARIMDDLARRQTEEVTRLEEAARAVGLGVVRTPGGLGVVPAADGRPLTHDEFHALPEKTREDLEAHAAALEERVEATLRLLRQNERETQQAHAKLVSDTAAAGTRQLVREVQGLLLDFVRESAYCAERENHPLVTGADVRRAIAQRTRRVNLLEERVGRTIAEGTLMLTTTGEAVGQVNGISVIATGDHAFGRPCRITARAFCGEPGVLDIEREAKLGGRVHSKGVMILTGFLAGRYAREQPLALSASIAFEQQYEEIEGDSASSAELYALLSSLAGIPLAQGIGVTGSVNQQGEIQPVGAVNEKIEGFFDACRRRGLTGAEGVLIPEGNARHLMLREDVAAAVRDETFHVWAARTVDEGLAVLSQREAGVPGPDGRYPEGSFNEAVRQALLRNVDRLKAMRGASALAQPASSRRRREGDAEARCDYGPGTTTT